MACKEQGNGVIYLRSVPESSGNIGLPSRSCRWLLECCGGAGSYAAIGADSWHCRGASGALRHELGALRQDLGFFSGFSVDFGSGELVAIRFSLSGCLGSWGSSEGNGEVRRR